MLNHPIIRKLGSVRAVCCVVMVIALCAMTAGDPKEWQMTFVSTLSGLMASYVTKPPTDPNHTEGKPTP